MIITNATINVLEDERISDSLVFRKKTSFHLTLKTDTGSTVSASGLITAQHNWGMQSHDMYDEEYFLDQPYLWPHNFCYDGHSNDAEKVRLAIENAFKPVLCESRLTLCFNKKIGDHLLREKFDDEEIHPGSQGLSSADTQVGCSETIRLPTFDMVVITNLEGGTITSNMLEKTERDDPELSELCAAVDAIESMVLSHAIAGIDIQSPAYLEGIEVAFSCVQQRFC